MDSLPMGPLPLSPVSLSPPETTSRNDTRTSHPFTDTLCLPCVDPSCLGDSFCVNPHDTMLTSSPPMGEWWSAQDQYRCPQCPHCSAGASQEGRAGSGPRWTLGDPLQYPAQISDNYISGYFAGFQSGLGVGQAGFRQAFLAALAAMRGSPIADSVDCGCPESLRGATETQFPSTNLENAQEAAIGKPPDDDIPMQDWVDLDAGAQPNDEDEDDIIRGTRVHDSPIPDSPPAHWDLPCIDLAFPWDKEFNIDNERSDDEETRHELRPDGTATRRETRPVIPPSLNTNKCDIIDLTLSDSDAYDSDDEGNDCGKRDELAPSATATQSDDSLASHSTEKYDAIDLVLLDSDVSDSDDGSLSRRW